MGGWRQAVGARCGGEMEKKGVGWGVCVGGEGGGVVKLTKKKAPKKSKKPGYSRYNVLRA